MKSGSTARWLIPIAVGSDGGNIGIQYGPGFPNELRLLADAGLPPMDIIVAATRNGARALGVEKEVGTVAPGRVADLILLDANPLENVANLERVTEVIARGKRLSAPRDPFPR
jgi:imidazolonepropionase-like amidohydrolase